MAAGKNNKTKMTINKILPVFFAFITTLFLGFFVDPNLHFCFITAIHVVIFIIFYFVYSICLNKDRKRSDVYIILSLSLSVFIIVSQWAMNVLPVLYYPRQKITLSPLVHEGSMFNGEVYLVAVQVNGKDIPIYKIDSEYEQNSGWEYIEEYDDYKLANANLHERTDSLTLYFNYSDDINLVFSRSAYGGNFLIESSSEIKQVSSFTMDEDLVGAMYVVVEKDSLVLFFEFCFYFILLMLLWIFNYALFVVLERFRFGSLHLDRVNDSNDNLRLDKPWFFACFFFSLLLSLSLIIGRKQPMFSEGKLFLAAFDWIMLFVILFSSTAMLYLGIPYIHSIYNSDNKKEKNNSRSVKQRKSSLPLFFFILLVLLWMPIYLCSYPGLVSSDSVDIIHQAQGDYAITNWHPVLYTLYIRFFLSLSKFLGLSPDIGLGLASLTQMLSLAAACTGSVAFLEKNGTRPIWLIFLMIYYAFCPIFAFYSVIFWKDIFFGIAMTAFVIQCFALVQQKNKEFHFKSVCLFCITGCWVSFARNNGIFVYLFTSLSLIIYLWKRSKSYCIPILISIALILFIQGPVYEILHITASPFTESIGIPLQQIGYAAVHEELSSEEIKQIEHFIPFNTLRSVYDLYTPDDIKFNKEFDGNYISKHKPDFFNLWLSLLLKYPFDYLTAHLGATDGYWNLINLFPPGIPVSFSDYEYEILPYESIDIMERFVGIPLYSSIFNEKILNNFIKDCTPSMAFMVFLLFLSFLISFYKRRYEQLLVIFPMIILWGTLMLAAPNAYQHRYLFAAYLAAPMLFILQISISSLNNLSINNFAAQKL